jgi:transposase
VGDVVAMSRKERAKLVEMELVSGDKEKLVEAAKRLRVSYRQVKRMWQRYKTGGAGGLVHRSRGRPSNRAKGEAFRQQCLAIYRELPAGFGPTLAAEKLAERGLEVDHETLRRWLVQEGMWERARRRRAHRTWREPKEHSGELVQLDGSPHAWFGDKRRPCLLNMVDDATGTTLALMREEETTEGVMQLLWRWIERYGVPLALYTDGKNVYVTGREPTQEEQLCGELPLTAFGTACKKLGIEIIVASSPQAKGRVERKHGVYQDRLVKELALRGVTTIDGANAVLASGFVDNLNRKFAHPAASEVDFHRPIAEGVKLEDVFVFEDVRTVHNDWTVRWENQWYQITGPKGNLPPAKGKVQVQRRLDGSRRIVYRDRAANFHPIPKPDRTRPPRPPATPSHRVAQRPAPSHPWRQYPRRTSRPTSAPASAP